jgi:murein DD-endopeptidase MepM/ murein hydrolase activator NlpD
LPQNRQDILIDLLKKLFERRNEQVTLLLFDDDNPHQQESHTLHPGKLMLWLTGGMFLVLIIVMLFFYLTPLGTLIFNKEDRAIRASVIEVRERIAILQDSLNARDRQLSEIQRVIRENTDTTFSVTQQEYRPVTIEPQEQDPVPETMTFHISEQAAPITLHSDQIIHSEIFTGNVVFPAEPPVSGSLTAGYDPDKRHFGIDIAANRGADVRAVADGVVVSSDWTINYGYIMHIQHANGMITVYKHFSDIFYRAGDIVTRGDIIGKVGETGILATGPHVHFEIWKNGASLDPALYINLY